MPGTTAGTATAGAATRITGHGHAGGHAARAAALRELPVRDSERAWTAAELEEVRQELQAEGDRLPHQLAGARAT